MFGMMRSPAESYAKVSVDAAVETADPHRLVLMLFDGAMTAISLARIQMQKGQIPEMKVREVREAQRETVAER